MSDGRNAQGYYSQNDEEKYILEWTPEAGRLLDIGAWWPTNLSNSRALIERGWSAVLVEPSPGPMRVLLEEYGGNERVTLIQGACVPSARIDDPFLRMDVTDYPVSTSDHRVYSIWKNDPNTKYLGSLHVVKFEYGYLQHRFGVFDFINIDAEGHSVELGLLAMDQYPSPACISIEHDGEHERLRAAAIACGYTKFHLTAENLVAAR